MEKVDLKKELKHLYRPSAKDVVQVDVPPFRFLMIDGEGVRIPRKRMHRLLKRCSRSRIPRSSC